MSDREPVPERDAQKNTAEYYRLNTKAIDDLIEADESNSPPVSPAEIAKYRRASKFHLPVTFKILFIKFWFPAAACFFFMWGLGSLNMLDTLVILSLVCGLITDLLTNSILRFFAPKPGAYDHWMLYPTDKRFISLPLNIVHAGLVIYLVYSTYNFINTSAIALFGAPEGTVILGVEPILFGLIYLGFDLLSIRIKLLFLKIVDDAKKKVNA